MDYAHRDGSRKSNRGSPVATSTKETAADIIVPHHTPQVTPSTAKGTEEHNSCVTQLKYACRKSNWIKFMLDAMSDAGCPVRGRHLTCEPCDEMVTGGFDPDRGIILCENKVQGQVQVNNTIMHELVHAYDHCRAHVDWNDCRHHACSEIRAAALSGDCDFWTEVSRGNIGFKGQVMKCARRRAILSVSMNPNCGPDKAKRAVDEVFDTCFKDSSPFHHVP